ncbi:MAG: glycosyl transferase family 1, partial [Bacteroidota bacterium]
MKILQVAFKVPYPPKDGGALAMLNMAIGYKDLGHVITVLSANTRKHFASIADFPDEIKEIADFHMVNVDTSVR